MEQIDRRDWLRQITALGVAAGVGGTLEAQNVSDTTRFFPGFKAFSVKTSGATISGVIGGQGPPVLLLNSGAMAPSVPAGGRYDGTGFLNSGLLGPPPPEAPPGPPPLARFELTFTKAGAFEYVCLVHLEQGQKGTVTVQARAAATSAPVALPVTGSAATSGGFAWPWLAAGIAGALLLAGLALRLRSGQAWGRRIA